MSLVRRRSCALAGGPIVGTAGFAPRPACRWSAPVQRTDTLSGRPYVVK